MLLVGVVFHNSFEWRGREVSVLDAEAEAGYEVTLLRKLKSWMFRNLQLDNGCLSVRLSVLQECLRNCLMP